MLNEGLFFLKAKFYFKVLIFILGIAPIFVSCKKEPRKKDLVYDFHDISIRGVDTVYSVSFPDPMCGYANTNMGLHKTLDAGETWTFLSHRSQRSIPFYDRNYGVMSRGQITVNGGLYWTYDTLFRYSCITDDGRLVGLEKLTLHSCLMYMTEPLGTVYHLIDTIHYYNIGNTPNPSVRRIESHMGYIIIIPMMPFYDPIAGYSHDGSQHFTIFQDWTFKECPVDLCAGDFGNFYVCGGDGYIARVELTEDESNGIALLKPKRSYFAHDKKYLALDYYDDFVVAVGEGCITTNKVYKEEVNWFKELLNPDKEPFTETFYLLDIINRNTLVTAGTGGKIYYGTF